MIKNKFVGYALFVALFVGVWNLCDYLYFTFIARSGYSFTVWSELGLPLIMGAVLGYFQCLQKPKE